MKAVVVTLVELLVIIVAMAAWVFVDARAHAGRGRPIISSYGSLQLNTPIAWFLACLVMWETFFPLYLDTRAFT